MRVVGVEPQRQPEPQPVPTTEVAPEPQPKQEVAPDPAPERLALSLAAQEIELRALPSAEHGDFAPASREAFWTTPYTVCQQSNRQGYRLEGETLAYEASGELRSHGIAPGIVQVPGGGQPIIQLADSATMGGYPKIAAVIEPDLWRIAQARPGDRLRFRQVTLAEAALAARTQQEWLAGIRTQLEGFLTRQRGWL